MTTPRRKPLSGVAEGLSFGRSLIENNARRFAADPELAMKGADLLLTVRRTNTLFQMFTEAYLDGSGLSPAQLIIMLALLNAPDALSSTEICKHVNVSMSNMTKQIDGLELSGLIRRSTAAHDGRMTRVKLTREGRKRIERLAPVHYDALAESVGLNTTELTALLGLLDRVRTSVGAKLDAVNR